MEKKTKKKNKTKKENNIKHCTGKLMKNYIKKKNEILYENL